MEAEAYEKIATALQKQSNHVTLPFAIHPGFDKIVWSVWDYILGPELMFTWETVPGDMEKDADMEDVSFDSAPGDGLEFDVDFQGRYLQTPVEVYSCRICSDPDCAGTCDFEPIPGLGSPPTGTTLAKVVKSATLSQSRNSTLDSETLTDSSRSSTRDEEEEDDPVPPLASLSISLSAQDLDNGRKESVKRNTTRNSISETSSITVLTEGNSEFTSASHSQKSSTDDEEETGSNLPEEFSTTPNQSNSTPDAMSNHVLTEAQQETSQTPVPMSDERYAATHSLSSEIYRHHLRDSVVDTKMFCVPDRSLVIGCFSFSAKYNESRAIHSVSLLLNDSRLDWYLKRSGWFLEYFSDLVPRLKASLAAESMEEILSRMTTEWNQFAAVLGALEHAPLNSPPPKVQDTLLAGPKLAKDGFLQRCVYAHLLSMGQSFVIGKERRTVLKWERTLSLFSPEDEKWCATVPSKNITYCPYIKLQGGIKEEIGKFMRDSCNCRWPVAIMDPDSQLVHISGPYWIQRALKTEAQKRDLTRILGASFPERKKKLQNEMKPVNKQESLIVKDFFEKLDLLPYDHQIRLGFIRQFLRLLAQKAYAFVNYVQIVTDSGNEPGKFKLNTARRALDLGNDADFWIVLPWAERMRPLITELIFREKF